jgi:uncharacterized protein YfiM (DUF2279 family)
LGAVRPLSSLPYALGALAVSVPCAAQQANADRWLGPDKPAHAFVAGWTTGVGYASAIQLDWDPADRRRAAVTVGLAASLTKEAFDRWIDGEPFSFKDLAADAVGIAAFVALSAAAER